MLVLMLSDFELGHWIVGFLLPPISPKTCIPKYSFPKWLGTGTVKQWKWQQQQKTHQQ